MRLSYIYHWVIWACIDWRVFIVWVLININDNVLVVHNCFWMVHHFYFLLLFVGVFSDCIDILVFHLYHFIIIHCFWEVRVALFQILFDYFIYIYGLSYSSSLSGQGRVKVCDLETIFHFLRKVGGNGAPRLKIVIHGDVYWVRGSCRFWIVKIILDTQSYSWRVIRLFILLFDSIGILTSLEWLTVRTCFD